MRRLAHYIVLAFSLALALPLATTATAEDYPKLRAGQWETTTTASRTPGAAQSKMTMCTDEAIQKQMMAMGEDKRREMCTKSDLRRDGGKYIGDSVCKIGGSTMTSHSVMTILGDTGYKTVVSATYDPPFMGMKESTTTIEGRNTGPCRDGLQPGDVVTPTGQKFNMKALANRPPAVPPATAK
jgi:hypothetical protein